MRSILMAFALSTNSWNPAPGLIPRFALPAFLSDVLTNPLGSESNSVSRSPLIASNYIFGIFSPTNLAAFASLLTASNATALHYSATSSLFNRPQECKEDRIVALLSPSGADFLVTLFAALRLGYGILLLASVYQLVSAAFYLIHLYLTL